MTRKTLSLSLLAALFASPALAQAQAQADPAGSSPLIAALSYGELAAMMPKAATKPPRNVVIGAAPLRIGGPCGGTCVQRGAHGIDVANLQPSHAREERGACHRGLCTEQLPTGNGAVGVGVADVGGAHHAAFSM